MIRRVISILILFSMSIHCASRLELLDYLYANRYSIANSFGISVETVITTCGFSYFQDDTLHIRQILDNAAQVELVKAQEIQLFLWTKCISPPNPNRVLINQSLNEYSLSEYNSYFCHIFHPPSC